MSGTLAGLSKRGAASEEAWAKQAQELSALAHRSRLQSSATGAARLAAATPSAAAQGAGMLPSIAAHYLRLDTPSLDQRNVSTPGNNYRHANHFIAGVCTGSPLFVRDTSLGSSLSLRGSKWAASTSTVEGVSLFDVRGAVKLMDGSSSPLPPQRALPSSTDAVLEIGKLRLRLLPDLTPSRALFWGSLLCVWTVAGLTTRTARSLGISSAEDVRAKCGEAMEPYARSFQDMLLPIRERLQTGQGAPRVSELTSRLKASMR